MWSATNFCEPEKANNDVDRRQAEARARVARIHSKGQNRSTDLDAIAEQIKERRAAEAHERNVELAHDAQRLDQARQLSQLEAKAAYARRQAATQAAFHNMRTRTENRTTWDINNPEHYTAGHFVTRGPDGTASVSSAQSFDGEDHQHKNRVDMQKCQIAQWTKQQVAEKEDERRRVLQKDREYQATVNSYNKIADDLEAQANALARRNRENFAGYNRGLANARCEAEMNETSRNKDLEAGEVAYQTKSDFLTEHKGTTYRYDSSGRRVPYHMKGFSDKEMAGIRTAQEKQRQELQDKRAREKAEAATYAKQQSDINRMWKLKEREHHRARTRDLMQAKSTNATQNQEKMRRDHEMNEYLKSVTTSERYHSNFETSDR